MITLEQRNGRIDRFGQTESPEITYLLTIPNHPKIKGDLRVLERLIEKEDHAHKNLGDVAWLLALHDKEKEEERIVRGIEEGEAPEEIICSGETMRAVVNRAEKIARADCAVLMPPVKGSRCLRSSGSCLESRSRPRPGRRSRRAGRPAPDRRQVPGV